MTVDALHRQPQYHDGHDLRARPYALVRTRAGADPVLPALTAPVAPARTSSRVAAQLAAARRGLGQLALV